MNTCTSMPNSAPAKASDEPHWPAPVSVAMRLDAGFLVVERLRHRGVGLVDAGGAHAFVLVVDARRGVERLLQPARAEQRRRPPLPVDVAHRPRNLDLALGAHLLLDQRHRKQRREIVGADRLQRPRVQHRGRRRRQVRHDVVPEFRDVGFVEQVLDGFGHGCALPRLASSGAASIKRRRRKSLRKIKKPADRPHGDGEHAQDSPLMPAPVGPAGENARITGRRFAGGRWSGSGNSCR